jgi:hypothetical protein
MKKPTLIIMAAGMGSRYGGLKQVDTITEAGEIILDFSLYDAMMAGFDKAIFVIRKEHRDIFTKLVDERAGRFMEVLICVFDFHEPARSLVHQFSKDVPVFFSNDEDGPVKTCHHGIIQRKVQYDFTCVRNFIHLLQAAVSGSHACSHYD